MNTEATDATARWSYRRIVTITVVVLAIVAAALAAAGSRQAPRVSAAQLDEAYAVTNAGSQLVLAANQPMRTGAKLTVTTAPSTGATVTERDGKVVVTFGQSLHFDTTYAVSVGPVTGKYTGAKGSLHYSFRTPSPRSSRSYAVAPPMTASPTGSFRSKPTARSSAPSFGPM